MRPLEKNKNDPTPSRLLYRLERLWLTPSFRMIIRYGLPIFVSVIFCTSYFSKIENLDVLKVSWREFRENTKNRPEFLINFVKINGANQTLLNEIRMLMSLNLPLSSYDVDLSELESKIELIETVKNVDLYINENIVYVQVQERKPAIYWRHNSGLELLDVTGVSMGLVENRKNNLDLPLIAGTGANLFLDEALFIYDQTALFFKDIIGLVRVGERRWDVILKNDRKIMLPAEGLKTVLKELIHNNDVKNLLLKSFSVLDFRNPDRIMIREREAPEKTVEIKLYMLKDGEI